MEPGHPDASLPEALNPTNCQEPRNMDISRYESGDPADVLNVPHERLAPSDRHADAEAFWVAVDCLRADEHPAAEAPERECVTGSGTWVPHDPWFFSEDATGELWCNRVVPDPENDR
jgi:hypothetical protein